MPLAERIIAAVARARALPAPARYLLTGAIVAGVFLARWAAIPILPEGYPFLLFFVAILLSAAIFDGGAGLFATGLSALLAIRFFSSSPGDLAIEGARYFAALVLFIVIGAVMALILEVLHQAVARSQRALAKLERSEHSRALLLREFRHRTRNDLGSLVSLLLLRARTAPSDAAREGLREAAGHAMALARVHTRLATANGEDMVSVDTREFIIGLCADLKAAQCGEGLRPVALIVEAESHRLSAERAVQLGLVLNETITNAMKYAFPEDRAGVVAVRFVREHEDFVLTVSDNGIGLPAEGDLDRAPPASPPDGSGLGTRLLRALAAQLRGSFTRCPGPQQVGTTNELRFPAEAPSSLHH